MELAFDPRVNVSLHRSLQNRELIGAHASSTCVGWKPSVAGLPSTAWRREAASSSSEQSLSSSPPSSNVSSEASVPFSFRPRHFDRSLIPARLFVENLTLFGTLRKHQGCVNTIAWSNDGLKLCTGSDDCMVGIWNARNGRLSSWLATGHVRNIFCARFSPDQESIVSCGMDGAIRLMNIERSACKPRSASDQTDESTPTAGSWQTRRAAVALGDDYSLGEMGRCLGSHESMVLKIQWLPGSQHCFLSTHNEGIVRLYDTREPSNSGKELISLSSELSSTFERSCNDVAFEPFGTSSLFVVGAADPILRLYDLRFAEAQADCVKRFCPGPLLSRVQPRRSTSVFASMFGSGISGCFASGVNWSSRGEIVATFSGADAFSFRTRLGIGETEKCAKIGEKTVVIDHHQRFHGHGNRRTFLKDIAFCCDGAYVATGSDDGGVYLYESRSGRLVNVLPGDSSIVNCVAAHPHELPILATSGIENEAKLWEPRLSSTEPQSHVEGQHNEDSSDGPFTFSRGGLADMPFSESRAVLRRLQRQNELLPLSAEIADESSFDEDEFIRDIIEEEDSEDNDDEEDDDDADDDDDDENDEDDSGTADTSESRLRQRRRRRRLRQFLRMLTELQPVTSDEELENEAEEQ